MLKLPKISNRTKTLALCALTLVVANNCSRAKDNKINTLKDCVQQNVSPEQFEELEEQASGFFTNQEQVWQDAYEEYCDPYKSYFEASQGLSK